MKKFITAGHIKIICAFILLGCLLLPFSSCRRDFDEDGKLAHISKKPIVKTVVEYRYPLQIFEPRNFLTWLFIYSFFWPIPILLYRRRGKQKIIKTILWLSEPLFVLGALYLSISETIFNTPAIGQKISFAANSGYGLAWAYELIKKLILFLKNKKRKPFEL